MSYTRFFFFGRGGGAYGYILDLHLKGHCHTISQKVSLHQLNSKTNDLVLLLKTV